MYNITLLFTFHGELGNCNTDELLKIIESISPDVIFEELSPALFYRSYNGNQFPCEPPEIKSIKRYIQNHSIQHVPVDIDENQSLSTRDIKYMFDAFQKYDVYRKLEDERYKMTEQYGYAFLNSKKYAELFEKMQ